MFLRIIVGAKNRQGSIADYQIMSLLCALMLLCLKIQQEDNSVIKIFCSVQK